ncbi:hypothetical protein, unlikely [Trypanosoma brucei gambiense DAL972]|uniref:Uncharacterized protein n=1 Tax=Trypanosoma brucei gambiense (strain MHOM/CI/86/DAL972) TaxID=679716 RepID=D0A3Y9_TRYB9|nr:hypothetical protein, unlikely [Trypanosoma brucei gambiense DAL972]CBH15983.1 hypothetical protein, unlikely [Trypanosoma brucei gambiense DAL972]|eukprot:XP_011778247.1 hypothetical protein, unlikely [Trypanosoma brucei gambiense DAL972]
MMWGGEIRVSMYSQCENNVRWYLFFLSSSLFYRSSFGGRTYGDGVFVRLSLSFFFFVNPLVLFIFYARTPQRCVSLCCLLCVIVGVNSFSYVFRRTRGIIIVIIIIIIICLHI